MASSLNFIRLETSGGGHHLFREIRKKNKLRVRVQSFLITFKTCVTTDKQIVWSIWNSQWRVSSLLHVITIVSELLADAVQRRPAKQKKRINYCYNGDINNLINVGGTFAINWSSDRKTIPSLLFILVHILGKGTSLILATCSFAWSLGQKLCDIVQHLLPQNISEKSYPITNPKIKTFANHGIS